MSITKIDWSKPLMEAGGYNHPAKILGVITGLHIVAICDPAVEPDTVVVAWDDGSSRLFDDWVNNRRDGYGPHIVNVPEAPLAVTQYVNVYGDETWEAHDCVAQANTQNLFGKRLALLEVKLTEENHKWQAVVTELI